MTPPVTVHRLGADGGRRVSVRGSAGTSLLGIAYGDRDVVEFLRRAGLDDGDQLLDDPAWVRWLGGRPHEWAAA
ncbi:hypothetical protein OG596_01000 [Streptomyces sp. NBC_01102]|uniref:hypothetical protein n=1 Tax=unclassified Streptomyces TaxID=2593676 RepID=UPI003863FA58|nr:hypothetical protein OG596_01000 [Streptomyces sp. NBC_01102]